MGPECCGQVFLVIVNIIFILIGLVFLAGGIFLKVGFSMLDGLLNGMLGNLGQLTGGVNLNNAATASPGSGSATSSAASNLDINVVLNPISTGLIVVGVFIFIIGILGCCGACCKVKFMLIAYVVLVGIICFAQIVIVGMFFTAKFEPSIKEMLIKTLAEKYEGIDKFTAENTAWNFFMAQFKCCGVNGYRDFDNSPKWTKTRTVSTTIRGVKIQRVVTFKTPIACCKLEGTFPSMKPLDSECMINPTNAINNWNTGCYEAVSKELEQYRNIAVGACVGVIVFQLLVIAAGIWIIVATKSEKVDDVA